MRITLFSFIIAALIAVDQYTKWFVSETLLRGSDQGFIDWLINAPERLGFHIIEVTSFFNWVMVWNWGVSFGLFNQESGIGPIILSLVSLVLVGVFVVWLTKTPEKLPATGMVMVIAGAIGNVIDRFRFGAVIDFIDIHLFGYHWPAFNAADSFISIGVILIIIHMLFFEKTLQDASKGEVE